MPSLADELKKIARGEVLDDPATITRFSTDASLFSVAPQVVVAPLDAADIGALVNFAAEKKKKKNKKISITARAAGTCMSGGSLNESVILDLTRHMNAIKEVRVLGRTDKNGFDGYATVEPGVYFRNLEPLLNEKGLMMPSYPASKGLCAVGGMVANNSGGEKTLAYGKTERYVVKLKVVLDDGREYEIRPLNRRELAAKKRGVSREAKLYKRIADLLDANAKAIEAARPKVSKNSAGYALWNVWHDGVFDLNRLLVGSQGTLGIITEITFGLVRKKSHSRLVVMLLPDLKPLGDVVRTTLGFNPESFESYDDNTAKLAIRYFPEIARIMKTSSLFSLGLQFIPDIWMVAKAGFMPKLILLAEITGNDEQEVVHKANALAQAIETKYRLPVRVTRNQEEGQKYWTMRRESFNLLRQKIKGKQTAPFIDDFCVDPAILSEFLPKLNAILDKHRDLMIYTIAGHAGDGNFHIIPLMDLGDPKVRAVIPKLMDKVYELVFAYHGSTTAEHNDGLIRSHYLPIMYGKEIYGLFEEAKEIFDPLGIFNPGKKIRSNLRVALNHMKKPLP